MIKDKIKIFVYRLIENDLKASCLKGLSYRDLLKQGKALDYDLYSIIYSGYHETGRDPACARILLDTLKIGLAKSLSIKVSDVIVFEDGEEATAHYVDTYKYVDNLDFAKMHFIKASEFSKTPIYTFTVEDLFSILKNTGLAEKLNQRQTKSIINFIGSELNSKWYWVVKDIIWRYAGSPR